MMISIRNSVAILNIFKNDKQYVADFIHHHAPMVKQLVMLDTGSTDDSFRVASATAEQYNNVAVLQAQFDTINFSDFRNRCLDEFMQVRHEDITHYFWVDTDEILAAPENIEAADSYVLRRQDASLRFSTWLQRGFSIVNDGKWEGAVHEGFMTANNTNPLEINGLYLSHLTSELERSQEK